MILFEEPLEEPSEANAGRDLQAPTRSVTFSTVTCPLPPPFYIPQSYPPFLVLNLLY